MTLLPSETRPLSRDPVSDADRLAILEARGLLTAANHASLSWTDAIDHVPGISRITFAFDPEIGPLTLISGLAPHFQALHKSPACALMVGEVGAKGDSMTHPRLMLRCTSQFLDREAPEHQNLRARWLERNPKATIYIDLPDFRFVRLIPISGILNGGFARAFRITPAHVEPEINFNL